MPYFLIVLFAINLLLLDHPFFRLALALQIAFYALALLGYLWQRKGQAPAHPGHHILLLPGQPRSIGRHGTVCDGEGLRNSGIKGLRIGKDIARKVLPVNCYFSLARWWHYLPNMGFKHRCPICGKHVKVFLPFGLHPRPNAKCPFCKSLERHRSIWLFLNDRADMSSEQVTILHLAPEACLRTKLSQLLNVHYVTADLDGTWVSVGMDAQLIPFQSDSFDWILCSHVLEHIPDDQKAMREMYRVRGGRAILQVPLDGNRELTLENANITSPEERERVFGQRDHVRIYGQDYKRRLSDAGFHVQFDSYTRELPADVIFKYGLSTQDIFLVSKPQTIISEL